MRHLLCSFIEHSYLWFVLAALIMFIGGRDLSFIVAVVTVACAIFGFSWQHYQWKSQDALILLLIAYMLLSVFFSDYPVYLWYLDIKSQLVPMLFFFLGSGALFTDNKMLEKMKWPIMFAMVVGLLLYFFQPAWYMARRTEGMAVDATESAFYERTRLSSFWPWSYAMGYASLIFLMYYSRHFFRDKLRKLDVLCFAVALAVLFFAQQRAAMVFFPIYLAILIVWGNYRHKSRLWWLLVIVLAFSAGIYWWLVNYADSGFVEYVLNRTTDSDENIVAQRFDMFANIFHISWFGEGLGKYGHGALYLHKMKTICDCEYMRLINEIGIIGTFIFAALYLRSVLTAFKYIQYYMFEFSVLLFFLVAMIGATPLENGSMQPFLLWYCMGRVNNKKLRFTPPYIYG